MEGIVPESKDLRVLLELGGLRLNDYKIFENPSAASSRVFSFKLSSGGRTDQFGRSCIL